MLKFLISVKPFKKNYKNRNQWMMILRRKEAKNNRKSKLKKIPRKILRKRMLS